MYVCQSDKQCTTHITHIQNTDSNQYNVLTFNIKIAVILKLILSEQLSTNSNIIIRAKLMYFSMCKFKINIPGIIKLHQKYKMQKSKPRFLLVTAPIVVQRDITPCINYKGAQNGPKGDKLTYRCVYGECKLVSDLLCRMQVS